MKYWFTSDLHLGHSNIIKLSGRPFKDVEDMDAKLIANWNSRVRTDDYVFHIGDFCYRNAKNFKNYLHALNGHIIFIKGIHDSNNGVRTPILDVRINHGGENLLLIHDPADIGFFGGKLALCDLEGLRSVTCSNYNGPALFSGALTSTAMPAQGFPVLAIFAILIFIWWLL